MNKKEKTTRRFRSLTHKLSLTFLVLGAIILFTNSALSIYFNYRKEQQIIIAQQTDTAQRAASTVQEFIEGKVSLLHMSMRLENPLNLNAEQQKLTLNELLGVEPSFRQIRLINDQIQELASASRISYKATLHVSDSDLSTIDSTIKQGKDYLGSVYFDEITEEPAMLVALPVKDVFGDVKGGLLIEVNLKFMWDLVGNIKTRHEGSVYVVNKQGDLIAYGDVSRVLKRENLSTINEVSQFISGKTEDKKTIDISKGIQNTMVVSTFIPLITPDWAVVVEEPVFEAYRTVIQEIELSFIIIVLSGLLGTGITILLSKKLAEPIVILRNAAKRIGQGDLDAQIQIASHDEIGDLAVSFNEMAANLKRESQSLQDVQAKLSASISSLTLGFIMTDRQNKVLFINQSARDIFNISKESLPSQMDHLLSLIKDKLENSVNLQGLIDQAITKRKPVMANEVAFQNKYLKVFITPILEDTVAIGSVLLIDDITEVKIMERSRDEFFSIASHELRTPLTAIRGNTSMIKEYYADMIKDKDLQLMLNDIHDSSIRLIQIVNDFLNVSRLEQGRMEFRLETFDLIELMKKKIEEVGSLSIEKGIPLKFTSDTSEQCLVYADRDRLGEVILNLLGNAIKYTEKGSVTIKTVQSDQFIKVSVSDTGKGVSEQQANLLFRKFQQAAENILTRDNSQSTGLGLYISKLLIESMHGSIFLEHSELGVGSTFSFTIPVGK